MGLFDFIEEVVDGAVNTVSLPIDITKDVLTGNKEKNVKKRIGKISNNLEDGFDELFGDDEDVKRHKRSR